MNIYTVRRLLSVIILLLFIPCVSIADQIAITEDGRKVLLKDDGTWEYVKEQKQQEHSVETSEGRYIREGSIGEVQVVEREPEIQPEDDFPLREMESWIGERFVFLPIKQDYKLLKGEEDESYKSFDPKTWYINLPYKEYVGRIAKVNSVTRKETSIFHDWIVELEMVDSGEKLVVKDALRIIPGIAPVADIDKARELWLSKTLWCKDKDINLLTYDADTGMPGGFYAKRYSAIEVTDIVAGESNDNPVRFIMRTSSGGEGYIDMNLSGTNTSNYSRKSVLEDVFFTEDPRVKYNCSDKVWSAILEGKVFIGMTDNQVRMSWGEPTDVNKTISSGVIHEQWVYGMDQYLYFDNGILRTIQLPGD